VKVLWSPQARQQRRDIWDYIASDNPRAADRIDDLFDAAAARLATHPKFGKPGKISGTREYIAHPSYRMVYEIGTDAVWIMLLIHTAREWPPAQD
jgi:addiction module RelE/StbE family toxin